LKKIRSRLLSPSNPVKKGVSVLSSPIKRLRSMAELMVTKFALYLVPKLAFMAVQIEILQKRLDTAHIKVDPEERAKLLALGAQFDHQVDGCFLIAELKTYRRWLRESASGKKPGRVGRKRTVQSIANVVLRMAKENIAWGFRRIVGELRKVGIKLSATCVKHILKREGIHPGKGARHRWQPARNWQEFIDTHMSSLLGCDFCCAKVLTWRGWVEAFVFIVIHLESRKVYISPATLNPNHLWLAQQVR
jgi:putative transposase